MANVEVQSGEYRDPARQIQIRVIHTPILATVSCQRSLSSVLFSQQPEGGDGRLIFTVSCFSFRGALFCTVACH